MKSKIILEPGIIKSFRIFTGVRIALVLFSAIEFLRGSEWIINSDFILIFIAVLDAILLFSFLSIPRLKIWFKQYHFPIAIIWATIGPILQLHIFISYYINHAPDRSILMFVTQPILVLFIPLVLISWQYNMQAVSFFCGFTFFTDLLLAYASYKLLGIPILTPIIGMAFMRTVMFLLVGNMIGNLMHVQREQHKHLILANDRLTRYAATLEQLTTSRERNRMARELHDVLAHTMSGVAVELEGVRALLHSNPEKAETLLGQSLQAVREGLTETRRSLQALRASPLEDLGLSLAISSLSESITCRSEIKINIDIDENMRDFPVEVQQCFYRVAQEALSNISLHAQAKQVDIALAFKEPNLELTIHDDGIGFDMNQIDLSQKYGLLGMRERVEMINGTLNIVSQPGEGTTINLLYGEQS
ncbi:MAG: sensor histidine kinase [Anaerolineaceae bacterium]|nr:sensor histidine kinase [Anaerolineaceae bacterium]